jgi:uncharacterized protein YneF (UPF0154 family)
MKKLILLFGAAIGYVAGAAAGRERYEQIRSMAKRAKDNPQVQEQASRAADAAKDAGPVVKDKVSGAADTVGQKAKGDPSLEDSAYPKG